MVIEQVKQKVNKSEDIQEGKFKIHPKNFSKLFKMLENSLYSDKPGSVMREYISNIKDSHRAAGNLSTNGIVSWIEENKLLGIGYSLAFQDFGTGLSEEMFEEYFCGYLNSSKDQSNDDIGSYGLGCKVGFSISDSFNVVTIFEGKKSSYLCFKAEDGLPSYSLLHRESSNEHNGTTITIPIKKEDLKANFQHAINTQLCYFKGIEYKGFNTPEIKVNYEDENCIIYDTTPFSYLHCIVGNIAYIIDANKLGLIQNSYYHSYGDNLNNCYVCLKFNIGEIHPTLSREDIEYDDISIARIKQKLNIVKKTISDKITESLEKEQDLIKFYCNLRDQKTEQFNKQWNFSKVDVSKIKFKGKLEYKSDSKEFFYGFIFNTVVNDSKANFKVIKTNDKVISKYKLYSKVENFNSAKNIHLLKDGYFQVIQDNSSFIENFNNKDKYYKESKRYFNSLITYESLNYPLSVESELAENLYKEVVKQRKLNQIFTFKQLITSDYGFFSFTNKEAKLDTFTDYIIYSSSEKEDVNNLLKIASFLLNHKECYKHSYLYDERKFTKFSFLKVSQTCAKELTKYTNAIDIKDVIKTGTIVDQYILDILLSEKLNQKLTNINDTYYFSENYRFFKDINSQLVILVKKVFTAINKKYKIRNEDHSEIENRYNSKVDTTLLDEMKLIDQYIKKNEFLFLVDLKASKNENIEILLRDYAK